MKSSGAGFISQGEILYSKHCLNLKHILIFSKWNQCQEVLSCPNRRLLVIGYGFRDLHINAVIAQSIRQHGLKLYVISLQSPEGFKNELHRDGDEDKKILWQGLTRYWNRELKDVCPASQPYFAEDIRGAIFPQ
jgi:hypothetical protein